jgi:hypothetical protein
MSGGLVGEGIPTKQAHAPLTWSDEFANLFPGEYELETGGFSTVGVAPGCANFVVETEVFVVSEASVA